MSKGTQLRLAVFSLIAAHAVIMLGGFIGPYDYAVQHREYSYAPPTRIHFVDAGGKLHLRPWVYAVNDSGAHGYIEARGRAYAVRFFVRGAPYTILGHWSATTHLFGVDEPGKIFIVGTDQYGRDQLSRILRGGQVSLLAGLLAATLSISLGLVFGLVAGYYGGIVDEVAMRLAELFMVLPWLYLLLAVKGFLPLNIDSATGFLLVIAVIGIVGWARPARLIRGIVLSTKERNYVLAARCFGASDLYLLRRHIFPETLGVILVQATLLVPRYSLSEMTLSFVGLGVSEPLPSWGNMLVSLQRYHVLSECWWMFLPAVPAVLIFWGYYTVSSALQEPCQ